MAVSRCRYRAGASTVELALVAPLLTLLFVIAVDFGRIYYYSITVTNCARGGALYAGDAFLQAQSPYTVRNPITNDIRLEDSISAAAKAEAPADLRAGLTVDAPVFGSDAQGAWVRVRVAYEFRPVCGLPGMPTLFVLSRGVTMRVAPQVPG